MQTGWVQEAPVAFRNNPPRPLFPSASPGFWVSTGLKDTCKPICPALMGCLNHTAAAGPEALCSSPPQTFIPDPRLPSRHRCWSRRQSVGFVGGKVGATLYKEARPLQFCEERSVIQFFKSVSRYRVYLKRGPRLARSDRTENESHPSCPSPTRATLPQSQPSPK